MGKHKNTVLVQAIYGAFLRGDIPAIVDKCADNVEWVVGSPGGLDAVPAFGTYKGKDGVMKFFQTLAEHEETKAFDPHEYIAQYDKVIALVRIETLMKKTGKTAKQEAIMVWTIKGGKVTHIQAYEDTQALAAAATP